MIANGANAARLVRGGAVALIAAAAVLATVGKARAIIQGHESSLDRHMVRVVGGRGGFLCSGVAIDRTAVVTAAHCGRGGVSADGRHIGVASVSRGTVTLDNGVRVTVAGDAAVLKLRSSLPGSIVPLRVDDGSGDGPFVIAGYGTPSEQRRSFGTLRQATLVSSHERHMLVDPSRKGAISASACFGDSGGPVLRRSGTGYVVVGVITRANYPNRPIACGFYTRYAPVTASGTATAVAARSEPSAEMPASAEISPAPAPRARRATRGRATANSNSGSFFSRMGAYFASKAEAEEQPRVRRHKKRRATLAGIQ